MNGFDPFGHGSEPAAKKAGTHMTRWIVVGVLLLLLIIVAANTVYVLESGTEAVITTFGAYTRTETEPGLRLKIPFVEKSYPVNVAGIRRMEFGYRTVNSAYSDVDSESNMLTGDENLVIADWAIQYRVVSGYDYLFRVQNPEDTFRIIAESAYRRVVASHSLDDILTNQKDAIQREVQNDLQDICNKYQLGISVTGVQLQDATPPDQVKQAFLDVTSAKEDKAAKINDAARYENEKLPMARGDSQKIINDAEAYATARINEAQGVTSRFLSIAAEYKKMPAVTRTRMYLEMIASVLPKLKDIYIVNPNGETVQFLSLNEGSTLPDGVKNNAISGAQSTSETSSDSSSSATD